MSVEELRRAALEAIASVAPDLDEERLAADQPLRAQVDLDSMDWLNIVVALDERLGVAIPEQDYGRVATLDDLVAYLSSHEPRSGPRPTAPAADIPAQPLARVHTIAGETVTVRPIRPDDAPMEADFVRHLSNETRYKRFMATMRELPKDKLRYLTEVDQVKHVALVAILERDGAAIEVGVARYIVAPSGASCEFAIAVDDEWQGTGLAGVLMHDLIAVARSRGLGTMEGFVLAANSRMLRFARQLGFRVERDPEELGTLRVVLALR